MLCNIAYSTNVTRWYENEIDIAKEIIIVEMAIETIMKITHKLIISHKITFKI